MSRIFSPQLIACLALSLALAACQGTGQRVALIVEPSSGNCSSDAQAFRGRIEQADVRDASSRALPSYPLLHSNRFLHSLAHSVETESETREWAGLLAELAIATRTTENRNLATPLSEASLTALAECARRVASEPQHAQTRGEVLAAVRQSEFPSNYLQGRQTLGALPVLRPFLKQRILALHADERDWFLEKESFARNTYYEAEPARSTETKDSVADWMLAAYAGNALALPLLTEAQIDALFARHAPSLQIEYEQDNDSLGAPRWVGDRVRIDGEHPTAYTLTSMTRFEGRNLLQLNYIFWFPARRANTFIDLYSGNVDSLIWRVTLDEEGKVLLYDSIHSCGCYHKYFLVADDLTVRSPADSKEPANIFNLDASTATERIDIVLTANEHYIVGVQSKPMNSQRQARSYSLRPYSLLHSLDHDEGYKSLFDSDGLIPGSERLERFTLWPTGILSVGAMRQWGTHATGFVEEQHFDDADLLEKYFEASR